MTIPFPNVPAKYTNTYIANKKISVLVNGSLYEGDMGTVVWRRSEGRKLKYYPEVGNLTDGGFIFGKNLYSKEVIPYTVLQILINETDWCLRPRYIFLFSQISTLSSTLS